MINGSERNYEEVFVGLLGVAMVLGGIAILAWQIYQYLKTGAWPAISLITAMQYCGSKWAAYPTDWIGLHKAFEMIPLSITLFVTGFITAISANTV